MKQCCGEHDGDEELADREGRSIAIFGLTFGTLEVPFVHLDFLIATDHAEQWGL